jgi:hypothetical protein
VPPRVRTSAKPACEAMNDSSSGVDVLLTFTGLASGSIRTICANSAQPSGESRFMLSA